MRNIQSIEVKADCMLSIVFDRGIEKFIDFKPYFKFPVFQILKEGLNFMNVQNRGYFIE
jgi:hypothetical protein